MARNIDFSEMVGVLRVVQDHSNGYVVPAPYPRVWNWFGSDPYYTASQLARISVENQTDYSFPERPVYDIQLLHEESVKFEQLRRAIQRTTRYVQPEVVPPTAAPEPEF